nr:putative Gag-polypeptide of LTR copia-type [Tanacetum cinerariifolium]
KTYDKVDGSATFNLHKSINSLSKDGMPLFDYYHKLNSLWRQFDALTSLPACSCTAKKEIEKHNELTKLIQVLMGLDDVYLPIISNILTRDPSPSVKTAFAIISKEESHRLGHPADQVLDALKTKLLFNANPTISPCEVYHKSKQTREPFPLSDHKSRNVGELTTWIYEDLTSSNDDDGRVSSNDDDIESPTYQEEDGDFEATSMDENTPPEGITETFLDHILENNDQPAETKTIVPRRSSRPSKVPQNLNDFVIEGKVKYGVERIVNYSNLSKDNFCFASKLNKSIESKTYQEDVLDSN